MQYLFVKKSNTFFNVDEEKEGVEGEGMSEQNLHF